MSLKKCKVVMLPTNQQIKKGLLGISCTKNKELFLMELPDSNGELGFWSKDGNMYSTDPQHLYFINDDKIKGGDWIYCNHVIEQIIQVKGFRKSRNDNEVLLAFDNNFKEVWVSKSKKIIASTDLTLDTFHVDSQTGDSTYKIGVPQPSKSFLDKFIDKHNQKATITECLVEYDVYDFMPQVGGRLEKLKVNNNNEITIKRCKESWSREEVINLFSKYQYDLAQHILKNISFEQKPIPVEWIKQNL